MESASTDLTTLVAEVVSAYVSNNSVPQAELPQLIAEVHGALNKAVTGQREPEKPEAPVPPVPINRTVRQDYIISLEDGRSYRTLKRHLTKVGLTPKQYREKWGLGPDYPMTAPAYSERRSQLAKAAGLGQKGKSARKRPGGQ